MSTDAFRTDPASEPRTATSATEDAFVPVARTAADLLAIMPHTLAMWPRRSAVLLTATSSEPGPCLRVDLPRPELIADELSLLEWTAELSELLEHDPIGDRLYLGLFVDGCSLSRAEIERVVEAVGEAGALSGHAMAGTWEVGPQKWVDLEEPEPRTEHPIEEIRSSALWTAMVVTGSSVEVPGPLRSGPDRHGRTTTGAVLRVEDCRALVRELDQRRWSPRPGRSRHAGPDPAEALGAWEAVLADPAGRPAAVVAAQLETAELAGLLEAVMDPLGSDALVVSALTGEHRAAAAGWEQASEDPEVCSLGEQLCWLVDVLVGRWSGRPDWRRAAELESVLELLLDLLHGAPADAPASEAVREAEAWLWVATAHLERFRARGSWACQWLELAEDVVPGHLGAARVRALGSRFPIPQWAGDRERSWHRGR